MRCGSLLLALSCHASRREPGQLLGAKRTCNRSSGRIVYESRGAGRMLATRLPKQNPQARGTLGGFCLELRLLRRIGVSGETGGHARAVSILAGRHCEPPLPFGPIALRLGLPGRPVLAQLAPFGLGNAALVYGTLCGPSALVTCLRRGGTRPLHKISGETTPV
jgi:hypothetical protein